jgi:hypothetical protein
MIEGTVWRVTNRDWNGKTLYSIKLDGNDTYYGCGERKPPCSEGQKVVFEAYEKNGRWNVKHGTVKVTEDAAPGPSPRARQTKANVTREEYWQQKAKSDERMEGEFRLRSAHAHANSYLAAAAAAGVLGKVDNLDKFEALHSAVVTRTVDALEIAGGVRRIAEQGEQLGQHGDGDVPASSGGAEAWS